MNAIRSGRLAGWAAWAMRLAGLNVLVNAMGFGAFDVLATWHFAHDHEVWYALGNPTYGYGPFFDHGIVTTVPLLLAFLGACVVLAIGGGLLLAPRPVGALITLAGIVMCAPFWWGFNLPFAWLNAATVLVLLALAWAARKHSRNRGASHPGSDLAARSTSAPDGLPVPVKDTRAGQVQVGARVGRADQP